MIEEFYDSTPQSLSQPALETLSVIAYKQPVSKEEIDEIRGISSEQSLKNLLNRDLVEKVTKSEQTKYATTLEFLKLMGISSVKELEGYGNENK
ncbi:MAG: SMC-Scp complex subunit ScpB [Patescibacteria group bacterium]|nr:SMC-Scp complex subunit ScpB [Patescibacteria group bacterium]